VKVEATFYGDRKVFSVTAFNRGLGSWIARLPTVWIEGEVTELRRNEGWANVFFTLKDPDDAGGACVPVSMPRRTFDALKLAVADGERVHVYGRPELYEAKGELRLRALALEPFGLGAHLAAIERLRKALAVEGLFAESRKRPLPRFPRTIALVTGNDAAAKRDVISTIQARFPAASVLVAETLVQGPRAAAGIVAALEAVCREPDVDVVVLTRGGGSFEDLLAFSDERVVRAVAACRVPVVSAVGHEQDTPLCDLAADVRASTPTMAGRLVVPDLAELLAGLARARAALALGARRALDRDTERLRRAHDGLERGGRRALERDRARAAGLGDRLRRAPALLVERRRASLESTAAKLRTLSPRATLERGYAIVRAGDSLVTEAAVLVPTSLVEVELAAGGFSARVEEVRP